jgi:Ca2+-binding RTX toxin-like protein
VTTINATLQSASFPGSLFGSADFLGSVSDAAAALGQELDLVLGSSPTLVSATPTLIVFSLAGTTGSIGGQFSFRPFLITSFQYNLPSGGSIDFAGSFSESGGGAGHLTSFHLNSPAASVGFAGSADIDAFGHISGSISSLTLGIGGVSAGFTGNLHLDSGGDLAGTVSSLFLSDASGNSFSASGLTLNVDDFDSIHSASDIVAALGTQLAGNDNVTLDFAFGATLDAGTGDDIVRGGRGGDHLSGGDGDDSLFGLAGNDTLEGGAGNDTLTGGAGDDSYVYDPADTIVEAPGGGSDTLRVDVTYTLAMPNIENLLLTGSADLDATGDDQNNALTGNSGANVLDGGAGSDAMTGGLGNDTYYVDSPGDTVIEGSAAGGTDQVFSTVSFTLGANVENLVLGGGAISGTGNGGANELTGTGSTDNVLSGGAGNDVLQGGRGEDVMMGGTGNDVYYVNRGDGAGVAKTGAEEDQVIEAAGAGTDTVHSNVYTYLLGANVENLVLEDGARRGYGNALDNEISGNDRNNFLFGAAGNDTLNGGLGADTLTGGPGEDEFVFDNTANIDRVMDFVAGEDTVVLSLAAFAGVGTPGNFNPDALAIGATALDADDRILYDSASGALYYDDDGSGADAAVQFATLVGHPALAADDIEVS